MHKDALVMHCDKCEVRVMPCSCIVGGALLVRLKKMRINEKSMRNMQYRVFDKGAGPVSARRPCRTEAASVVFGRAGIAWCCAWYNQKACRSFSAGVIEGRWRRQLERKGRNLCNLARN